MERKLESQQQKQTGAGTEEDSRSKDSSLLIQLLIDCDPQRSSQQRVQWLLLNRLHFKIKAPFLKDVVVMSGHVLVFMFKGIVHSKIKFGHHFSPSCLSKIFSLLFQQIRVRRKLGLMSKFQMVPHTKLSDASVLGFKTRLLSCHAHGNIYNRTQPSCGFGYNTVVWLEIQHMSRI